MKRCYCEAPLENIGPGERIELPPGEVHHVRNVLRLKVGDTVELFDGRGWSVPGQIHRLTRDTAEIEVACLAIEENRTGVQLWLAVAPPKHDRLRWMVEKAVELGVDRLSLLTTNRSVVEPGEGKRQKLMEAAIQACKQCGRNQLPRLEPACPWGEFLKMLRELPETDPEDVPQRLLIGDRLGEPLSLVLDGIEASPKVTVIILIGPEGGLTPDEMEEARTSGGLPTCLGPYILRVETAAIAAAAAVRSLLPTPSPMLPGEF